MKEKYIKVCIIVAIILNLVAVFTVPHTINCNKRCVTVIDCDLVMKEINGEFVESTPAKKDPKVQVTNLKNNDGGILFSVLVALNVMYICIVFPLYFVIVSLQARNNGYLTCSAVALALVVCLSALGCMYIFKRISKWGEKGSLALHAPIIYLYDEQCREVSVKLDVKGDLTTTYPVYDGEEGWTVKTSSDGTLTDDSGRQYEYLFWEADADMVPDTSCGFCIRGEDSAAFLETALSDLGLTDTEANTFIMYWLPLMECNPYNVICFQTDRYEDVAKLDVSPMPDTIVRVNMFFFATDEYIEMAPQDLSSMNPAVEDREGLVLVEWGGETI